MSPLVNTYGTIDLSDRTGLRVPQEERLAAAADIYPGMLLMVNSSGKFAVHSTAGGKAQLAIAIENSLYGSGVLVVYPISTPVRAILPPRGGIFMGVIATGLHIYKGDLLCSAGDGTLVKATLGIQGGGSGSGSGSSVVYDTTGFAIARAEEEVDNSGGTGGVGAAGTSAFVICEAL
jgi:hypothetical protein